MTVSVEAAAGETAMVELVPVIEPVTVSVAVTVRLPACVRMTALVKVCVPLSPPDEGVVGGEVGLVPPPVKWTVPV